MRRKIFFLLLAVILVILFSGFFWLYQVRYFTTRADVTQYSFSVDNSYVFATPLQATANNDEKIRVTVIILNSKGLGVLGKKVSLKNQPHLTIETIQGVTDSIGKAIFDTTSNQAGEYSIDVMVEDTALPQKVHLSYN